VDGVAYVAANRYQMDDNKPYLWKTADFGKTWTRIESNLPDTVFTRVVREDPGKRGLLVAGTERGIWFSPNDGGRWQSIQLNLPPVPVHDLVFKEGDIVLATHGRGFQIMDNISSLRQVSAEVLASNAFLHKPLDQYRVAGGGRGGGGGGGGGAGRGGRGADGGVPEVPVHPVGENPPAGIVVQYWLKSAGQTVGLEFLDAKGQLIHKYSTADTARPPDAGAGGGGRGGPAAPPRVPNRAGVNTFTGWNMRYEDASTFRGIVLWAANTTGPLAPPGTYQVRFTVDGKTIGMQSFKLLADPRLKGVSQADYDAQFALLMKIRDKFSQTNDAVKTARYVKRELEARGKELPAAQQGAFNAIAGGFADSLTSVEDSLYQGQSHASEDPLNYPIRLNNRVGALLGVVGSADGRPTKQSYEVYDMLSGLIDGNLVRMKKAIDTNLPKINAILKAAGMPDIVPKAEDLPLPAAKGPIG
jgi:hypothetical protein